MIQIDMEMPKNCKECRFMYQDTGELNNGEEVKVYMCSARSQGTAEKDYADKRSEWCPLHEVNTDPNTVSRQQAIDAVEFGITYAKAINKETGEVVELFKASNDELRKAVDRIKNLPPSPTQSRPHGQWIPCTKNGLPLSEMAYRDGKKWYGYKCSNCTFIYKGNALTESPYCQNCGADMRQNGGAV